MSPSSPTIDDLQDRIADIEQKLMFQEETIESLSDVVTKQWAAIDKLQAKLKIMDDQLYEMEVQSGAGAKPGSEPPPPHY
ncbi:hypothetical protein GCM10017044_15850 [Kordiimonas sediminis]|uniref:Protein SlyX homolog n=1 Tax=Kordiimonas sediminis TaxID=1735581 RepID=A0A919ARH4_9PROT|nr:SlyX family protein [Kordiimonas sediminis]GHF22430.1 hypothetical protein GCM10017044_15850 [Kordiimonas sediminis]